MEIENQSMRRITILLTRYSDLFGRFICGICKDSYSHASISIDDKEELFYSFNFKGFVIEKPKKYIPKTRKPGSVCIRMQVPEDTYQMVEAEINDFLLHREKYVYSTLGIILCLLRIPHKFRNQYFCSQFVAEVLSRAGAIHLQKKESLYLPSHLIDGIECLFSQKQLVYNVI